MTSPEIDYSAMARALAGSPDFRVLRRLKLRDSFRSSDGQPTKIGILLDVETTGLDTASDEIVELGMVKFTYLANGDICAVIDTFSSLNESTRPIPTEASNLHKITDEMVAGHRIDSEAVSNFVADANIVIAHNASFDRRFAERYWQIFVEKPWGCSVNQVDWRAHGFEGSRLGYLLAGVGLFHEAHRAVDDCRALLEILAYQIPSTQRSALGHLLEVARQQTTRIWADHSPFELRNELKKRGYRWNAGENGRARAWYIDVEKDGVKAEISFLQKEIYRRELEFRMEQITALERFSIRA